jgi:hypothetical protein
MGQIYNDLQHDEVIRSSGEVNELTGWPFVEALPTVQIAHGDRRGYLECVPYLAAPGAIDEAIDIVRARRGPNNVSNLLRFCAEGRTITFSSKRKKHSLSRPALGNRRHFQRKSL